MKNKKLLLSLLLIVVFVAIALLRTTLNPAVTLNDATNGYPSISVNPDNMADKEPRVLLDLFNGGEYERALAYLRLILSKQTPSKHKKWFMAQHHAVLLAIGWQSVRDRNCQAARPYFEQSINLKMTQSAMRGLLFCMEKNSSFQHVDEYCQSFFGFKYDKDILGICVKGYEKSNKFNAGIQTLTEVLHNYPKERKAIFNAIKKLQIEKIKSKDRVSEVTGFFNVEIPSDLEDYRSMIMDTLESGLQTMSLEFGVSTPEKPIRVVIYTELKSITSQDHVPGWAGAIYDGSIRVPFQKNVVVKVFKTKLLHELFHALLDQQVGGFTVDVWINEGLAQYVSCKIQECQPVFLNPEHVVFMGKRLLKFNFMKSKVSAVASAYEQSHFFMHYFANTYGESRMRDLIESINPKRNTAAKIFKELGLNVLHELQQTRAAWNLNFKR